MTSFGSLEGTGNGGGNEIMDPDERIKRFGIECVGPYGDGILFAASTWKPGGEYVQKLALLLDPAHSHCDRELFSMFCEISRSSF
jgi:hypothetical protein